MTDKMKYILMCGGTACTGKAKSIEPELKKKIDEYGLSGKVKVIETVYFGMCGKCPLLLIYPDEIVYERVQASDLDEIVRDHLRDNKPIQRLINKTG